MPRINNVRRVEYVAMELERTEADYLLLFLDKARAQMVSDGSNTASNLAVLNSLEQALHGALRT